MAKTQPAVTAVELKATIEGIKPVIWRQLRVPTQLSLEKLHRVLQVAFGWNDSHLHEFVVGKTVYGPPSKTSEAENEKKVHLDDLGLKKGKKLSYRYDFGDGWRVEVAVTKLLTSGPSTCECLGGERAGPIEDSGGVQGFERMLDVMADPEHPEHDDLTDWIGGAFNPEAVDHHTINTLLRRLK